MRRETMLIDGLWVGSGSSATLDIDDPATGEIIATAPAATAQDLERAMAAAERGFIEWRRTVAWDRSEKLRQAARNIVADREIIASLLTEEQGKPLAQARAEVDTCVEQFEWFADEARRIYGRTVDATHRDLRIEVRREPIGPVAAFTPWNFPIMLAARKMAPALAAGCSIILTPAIEAPSACLAMVRAIQRAEFPAGVVNAVTGDPALISETLIGSGRIRKVSLTGSIRVGKLLMKLAADSMTNVSMELGGHGPVIVWDDVDVEAVARLSARTKFRNAGQVCVSPTRFYVRSSVIDEFTRAFLAETASIRVGDGRHAETAMGPLASTRRLDEVDRLVHDAVETHGAALAAGGRRIRSIGTGHYYEPTVLLDVPDAAPIMSTEPFGPVAMIAAVESLDEAITRANATPYGLAAYVFTRDVERIRKASENVEAGMVGVNNYLVSTAVAPFSGVKASGIGAENGTEAMDSYTTAKTVVVGVT